MEINDIYRLLPVTLRKICSEGNYITNRLQELRLRTGKPFMLLYDNREICSRHIVSAEEIRELFEKMSEYSAYAYEEEMKQGFITLPGGHRAGIAGRVINEDGRVKNIRNISSISLRIASEKKGCAQDVIRMLFEGDMLKHTLIISPPGGGKTTLLRDIVRLLSDGNGMIKGKNVGVVDERSEICACYRGVPQNDVGIRTDVLDVCPKAEGMMRLVRSMSPDVIAVDEIGTHEDLKAIRYVLTCGCAVIATLHGTTIPEQYIEEGLFDRYIILSKQVRGRVISVTDKSGKELLYD